MSAKSRGKHNRWRSLTVAFRISPQENEVLNRKVFLCGTTKQEFIINRLIADEPLQIVVNRLMISRLSERLDRLINLLENSQITDCDIEEIQYIIKLLLAVKAEEENLKE